MKKQKQQAQKPQQTQKCPKLKVRSGIRAGYYVGITLSAGGGSGTTTAEAA